MVDILCLTIQNKKGKIVTVPLVTWENGLHKDPDWHIYEPPKPPPQPLKPPVIVELIKPPPVVVKPVVKKAKRKGK